MRFSDFRCTTNLTHTFSLQPVCLFSIVDRVDVDLNVDVGVDVGIGVGVGVKLFEAMIQKQNTR